MTVKSLYPTVLPSLNLDFANSKKLDPRITFTRASTGTFVNENGLVTTAASGAARFDHDPVTGKCLGLLVEEARTNYLFAFASPNFNWLSAAVYSTYSDSRFGAAQNAHSWTWATATVNHEFGWFDPGSLSTTGNGVQYTVSFWAKANQAFTLQGNIQDERRQTVNFAASLTTSWQYFSFSTPAGIADDGSGTVYFRWLRGVVNVPAGLQIDFAAVNLERGGFPTSYIPTAGSTVTRAADVATLSNTGSSIFPTSAFTTVNSPFGTAGGGSTVKLVGPTIARTAVYAGDLPQAQINALAGVNDGFWRWRVVGNSFALPSFTTNGTVTVDWGDGVIETLNNSVHTFTNGGGYHDIGFRLNSGTFFKPFINENATYRNRVIAVGPAPASMRIDAQYGFRQCNALKTFDATVDATATGDFSFAWSTCSSLVSFPLINTSAGTAFQAAWDGCSSLTSFALINTGSGTGFAYAWRGCSSLTSFPLINTALGTDFQQAWISCSSLTSFPLLNTGAATNFQETWQNCSSLTSFPANMFNTTGTLVATAFASAFAGCALTATSIENILTSLVTNGQSNITLGLNGGTNANASTWSTAANTAYATLVNRGWTITQNGTPSYGTFVSLLLHGDGTNGSTTITDNSFTPKTVTAAGNAQISTAQSKFGGASIAFDGTGDSLTTPNDSGYQFGTSNFTVECWINTTDTTFNLIQLNTSSPGNWCIVIFNSDFYWQTAYGATNLISALPCSSILNGAWNHIAITRSGSSLRLFFNGVLQGASPYTDNTNYNGTGLLKVGSGANGDLNGYIDDLRITKGVALYTANFTPPTAAFPNP